MRHLLLHHNASNDLCVHTTTEILEQTLHWWALHELPRNRHVDSHLQYSIRPCYSPIASSYCVETANTD